MMKTSLGAACVDTVGGTCHHQQHHECVDTLPLVAARHWFYEPARSIPAYTGSDEIPTFAVPGDIIEIEPLHHFKDTSFLFGSLNAAGGSLIQAEVIAIRLVSHFDKLSPHSVDTARPLLSRLCRDNYISPQSMKSNPTCTSRFVKPGDTIAQLRAVVNPSPRDFALFAVFRFWNEDSYRDCHIFCVPLTLPGGSDLYGHDFASRHAVSLDPAVSTPIVHISIPRLDRPLPGKRGASSFTPVSSSGFLRREESSPGVPGSNRALIPYFVYRFLLYADDFTMYSDKHGSPVSGTGVYLVPLNLPVRLRTVPSSSRILALTPPGVSAEQVLSRIKNDLITGTVEGFDGRDPSGRKVRIFLDLVGLIGDTPGLNRLVDCRGHNALAHCHLCRHLTGPKDDLRSFGFGMNGTGALHGPSARSQNFGPVAGDPHCA